MKNLQDILKDYVNGEIGISDEERSRLLADDGYVWHEAPNVFKDIALAILNGCFLVTSKEKEVKIVPTCVEIYYHEEEDGGVKDPIVYHRNKKNKEVEIFPFGTLHNHVSGIDITFESGRHGKTRASALIREFRIENGQNCSVWGLKENEERSTYIYAGLFSQFDVFDGFTIKWEDGNSSVLQVENKPRKNVMRYDKEGKKLDKMQDPRRWQFRLKL